MSSADGPAANLQVQLTRAAGFSAAHRYFNPQLNEAQNRQIYGTLFNVDGFGHNFWVEFHFSGSIDPLTGMIANLRDVDVWIKNVLSGLDHKDLNQLETFVNAAPTPERIALFIREKMQLEVSRSGLEIALARVRLYEGEDLWVDC